MLATALALSLSIATIPQGRMWAVDASGNGDYTTIQGAINAAADGDVIVIVDPPIGDTYAGFDLVGKGVSIIAFPGGLWLIDSSTIRDLPAGSSVYLRGLGFNLTQTAGYPSCGSHWASSPAPGLEIHACDGIVHLDRCSARAIHSAGVDVVASSRVVMSECELLGGTTVGLSQPALKLVASTAMLEQCTLRGGMGSVPPGSSGFQCNWCTQGGDGGPALLADATSYARATESSFRGGDGGILGLCFWCDGNGAPAIVAAPGGRVDIRNAYLQVGTWGSPPGETIGDVQSWAEPAVTLDAPTDSGVSGHVPITVTGEPGDLVYLLLSGGPGFLPLGSAEGPLLVGTPIPGGRRGMGTIAASGTLHLDVYLPPATNVHADQVHIQAALITALGVRFTRSRVVTLLAPDAPFLAADEVVHVDPSVAVPGTGRSWSSAQGSLHQAIRRSFGRVERPAEFWIAEGLYRPGAPGDPQSSRFIVPPGTTLRGGFAGFETSPEQRDIHAHPTILSGDLSGDDGPGGVNRTDNANVILMWERRAVCAPVPAIADGLTIIGGNGINESREAAIRNSGPLRLVDCAFLDNDYPISRVVVSSDGLSALRCQWVGNRGNGWGVASDMRDVLVASNDARWIGFFESNSVIVGCAFVGNRTWAGIAAITRATTTFADPITIHNTIVWGNTSGSAQGESAQIDVGSNGPTGFDIRWNCVMGWTGTLGDTTNFGLDPRFVDALGPDGIAWTGDEDLRLGPGSPCVDAGSNSTLAPEQTVDLDGNPRRVDDPAVADTGEGLAPIVDIGPYERQ